MIVGVSDFRGGETLKERVGNDEPRKLRNLAGWTPSKGEGVAIPEALAERVSTSKLTGTIPAQVPIVWRDDDDGVRFIARDATAHSGANVRLMNASGVWAAAAGTIRVLADSTPFRLNNLFVFPEDGASGWEAKLVSLEPLSGTTTLRPLSFKGPRDYDDDEAPAVTQAGFGGTQMFNITSGSGANTWLAPGTGCVRVNYTDYSSLSVGQTTPVSHKCFTHNLEAGTVSAANQKYLVMDLIMTYTGSNPTDRITESGLFVNGDQQQLASGFELVLYSDGGTSSEITRYIIPQIATDGNVHRVAFHLGTMPSTTIGSISINTASYYVAPAASGDFYTLWPQSFVFDNDWKYKGNYMLPNVVCDWSPWADELPPDSGTKTAGEPQPTAASIIERFPESFDEFFPPHPKVKYMYSHRGQDQLSAQTYYNQMLSNPSRENIEFFADPWRVPTIAITLPTDTYSNDVEDDYGDYVTHALLYRSVFSGLSEDENTGEAGIWTSPLYIGFVAIAASMSFIDSERTEVPCTMNDATNDVTCTAHFLSIGQAIFFEETTGGVTANKTYFVTTIDDANTFSFSTEVGGSDFNVSADGSNSWTTTSPSLLLDTHDLPEYVEVNHDYADSARFAITADNRVYAASLTYRVAATDWDRKRIMMVSNQQDYASYPTTPGEDTISIDGSELEAFAPGAARIRGMLAKDEVKFLFTDNGFFELVGYSAESGWQFLRRDSIGCKSAKTIADCRSQIIWHDGGHFYSFAGGLAQPISEGLIDSSLIDFTKAHGAVFSKERYVFFCNYADTAQSTNWCLMIYDLRTGGWRRRHSTAYQLAGISVLDASGDVYGLTHDGDVVNIFGGTTDYGGTSEGYTIDTQYIRVPTDPPGIERHARAIVVKAITDQASISATVSVYSQGRLNNSDTGKTLTLTSGQAYYEGDADVLGTDLQGDAFRVVLTYAGANPPDVYFVGLQLDDTPIDVGV